MNEILDGLLASTERLTAFFEQAGLLRWQPSATSEPQLNHRESEVPRLDRKRKKEIRAIFDMLDTDGNHKVTAKEAKQFAKQLNIPGGVFTEDDYTASAGGLDYPAFERMVVSKDRILSQAFDSIDVNGDGFVDLAELEGFLRHMQLRGSSKGKTRWRIGRRGIAKMMQACEIYREGYGSTIDGRISRQDLQSIFLVAVDERDLIDVSPFFMRVAVELEGEFPATPAQERRGNPFQHLISGGVASAVAKTFVAPLNVLAQQQAFLRMQDIGANSSALNVAGQLFREGGLSAFWRGNLVSCAHGFPSKGLSFFSYELFKGAFDEIDTDNTIPSGARQFCAGALAGGVTTVSLYPIDTISTRLAVGASLADVIKGLSHPGSLRDLYQGLGASVAGIIPMMGLSMAVYEDAKRRWRQRAGLAEGQQLGHLPTLLCASLASLVAVSMTFPLNTIRKRMQMQALLSEKATHIVRYTGMADCVTKVVHSEGISGLFVGLPTSLAKNMPSSSIQMLVYEQFKHLWRNLNEQKEDKIREDKLLCDLRKHAGSI